MPSTLRPARLAFSVQPGGGRAGEARTVQPTVVTRDAGGNPVAASPAPTVTSSLLTNPGGGTLRGTTAVAASGGVPAFSGLGLNRPGVGYRLIAASPGLEPAYSEVFDVAVGTPSQLVFLVQPATATPTITLTPTVAATLSTTFTVTRTPTSTVPATFTPSATSTPSTAPTATSTASASPTPTATPAPDQLIAAAPTPKANSVGPRGR